MCQATVYLGDQEVAREVIWLEPAEDGVRLATFFEEPKAVAGRIQHIDFLKHQVLLEAIEEEEDERD
jgi:predicted RNA-binding protein